MAIPRLSVKVGKVGKAQPHAAYIARLDKYAHRLESGEKLEATGYGNMPEWAQHDPLVFWQAADQNERKNGSTYREHEIALPRELSESQRLDLLDDWIKTEIGDRYAYQYAIHNPTAQDGKENPHVHLMFSERTLDGIQRDPDQFFKRYNPKNPEKGGAKKDNTGKGHAERRESLKSMRHRWQVLCNEHLGRAGINTQIDMRSYKDQGKETLPEKKIGHKAWRNSDAKAELLELRQVKKDLVELVGDAAQLLKTLEADAKRIRTDRDHKAQLDPKNIEKVFNGILAQCKEIVKAQHAELEKRVKEADQAHSDWYKHKPEPPTGLLAGFKKGAYQKQQQEWEAKEKELRHAWINAKHQNESKGWHTADPHRSAVQLFEKHHPEMAAERERLQQQEKAAKAEEARQHSRNQPQRSRSRSRDQGR